MTDRPILYASEGANGSLVLERHVPNTAGGFNRDHVATLFYPEPIREALTYGFVCSDGWKTRLHRVIGPTSGGEGE
jgi:hypothetical protein